MPVTPASGETRVNTATDGIQDWSSVASLKDGGWIVTWGSRNVDGTPEGIYQQRYDAKGLMVGDEVQVNHFPVSDGLREVSTTGLSDGGWVVTWARQDESGEGIFQQRYNVYGLKVGYEARVNTTTADAQTQPAVTALAGGGWLVTWSSYETSYGTSIHQQRYGANGFPIGKETVLESYRYGSSRPSVTALSDGGWVVTYQGYGPEANPTLDIFQQRYDADGWTVDLPIRAGTSLEDAKVLPTVTGLKDGGWVVTWTSETGDDSGFGIRQQRYAINGQKVGLETLVNTTTTSDQFDSSVTALADGGWLVIWTSGPFTNVPDAPVDIYMQRFAANGQRVGGETRVNTFTGNDQSLASVTTLKDGGWVVTWKSFAQDGDHYDIYQQRFTANGTKIGPTTPTELTLSAQPVKEGASDATVVGVVVAEALVAEGFTYTLLNDAGGRFRIEGNQIKVRDGTLLDYEQARTHQIKVQVKDAAGAVFEKSFVIQVADVGSENLAGGSLSDSLTGGRANDIFSGKSGHDRLKGGAGNDVLTGGAGRDVFVFDTRPDARTNRDRITDFTAADDSIWLDNAVFTKLGKGSYANPKKLNKAFFKSGDKPKDKNDYLIYSKNTGKLSYDADGSGTKVKAIEIASLKKGLALTYHDFFVI